MFSLVVRIIIRFFRIDIDRFRKGHAEVAGNWNMTISTTALHKYMRPPYTTAKYPDNHR